MPRQSMHESRKYRARDVGEGDHYNFERTSWYVDKYTDGEKVSKTIGPFQSKAEALKHAKGHGWGNAYQGMDAHYSHQGAVRTPVHRTALSNIKTRAVAGSAYRNLDSIEASLTHAVDQTTEQALCRKVKPRNILDDPYAVDDEDAPATCVICAKKDPRFSAVVRTPARRGVVHAKQNTILKVKDAGAPYTIEDVNTLLGTRNHRKATKFDTREAAVSRAIEKAGQSRSFANYNVLDRAGNVVDSYQGEE